MNFDNSGMLCPVCQTHNNWLPQQTIEKDRLYQIGYKCHCGFSGYFTETKPGKEYRTTVREEGN